MYCEVGVEQKLSFYYHIVFMVNKVVYSPAIKAGGPIIRRSMCMTITWTLENCVNFIRVVYMKRNIG